MTTATPTSTALAATSSTANGTLTVGSNLKVVGIILAIASGVLIGTSFPLKKKGLLRSQAGGNAGEGVAYLKSFLWCPLIDYPSALVMILGELCNFAAYAFVEAIVVTPLGALSVVISAILSSFFLNEKLSFFGWLGCGLCILGSVIIALNGPHEQSVGQIREFEKLFLAPGFLAWGSVLIAASLVIIFYFAPRYGKKSMLWYITVCSMIGGLSVSVTTGLGAAIVTSVMGDNQFKYWFIYFLLGFVVVTLLTEIYYLNIALAMFNTAMVTPTYYVIFTFFTMVTTIILFKGLNAPVSQIITIVMGFLVICLGITILQMSKVDPKNFEKLDRRSTLLLQAARSQTENTDEKGLVASEDPGMDTLRGSFGTVGTIIRARTARRNSQSSRLSRPPGTVSETYDAQRNVSVRQSMDHDCLSGMKRHQLYDAPVPRVGGDDVHSMRGSVHSITPKRPTIKFDAQDIVHSYNRPGTGDNTAMHEHRQALGSPSVNSGYPPLPSVPASADLMDLDNLHRSRDNDNVAGLGAGGRDSGNVVGGFDLDKDIGSGSQLLEYPPLLSRDDQVPQSAPATLYNRYPPNFPTRKDDWREVSERTSSTMRNTLLSFPSVTDSARSQDWDEEELERIRQEDLAREQGKNDKSTTSLATSRLSGERQKDRRKKYPKADPESDLEESESLWRKSLENESEEGGLRAPGIRLVQTRK